VQQVPVHWPKARVEPRCTLSLPRNDKPLCHPNEYQKPSQRHHRLVPAFQYSPLEPHHRASFRLLDILPGAYDELIKCTLTHDHCKAPSRAYEALSYIWEGRQLNKVIPLNGLPFEATEYLQHALRNLRDSVGGNERTIWIDAMCICIF
jgi:hypothetical protein